MVWRYGSERTAVDADNEGAIALLKFCEPAQLVKDASGCLQIACRGGCTRLLWVDRVNDAAS